MSSIKVSVGVWGMSRVNVGVGIWVYVGLIGYARES